MVIESSKRLVISERHLAEIYPRLRRFTRGKVDGDQFAADQILQTSILMAIEYFQRTKTEPDSIEIWLKKRIGWNCKNYFKSLERDKKRFGKQKIKHEQFDAGITAKPREKAEVPYEIENVSGINVAIEDSSFTQKKERCWSKLEKREQEILEYSYGKPSFETLERVFELNKKTLANILSRAKIQFIKCIKSQE
jgi:DNA-directed RNA polymerase specialized sigma24 family protein